MIICIIFEIVRQFAAHPRASVDPCGLIKSAHLSMVEDLEVCKDLLSIGRSQNALEVEVYSSILPNFPLLIFLVIESGRSGAANRISAPHPDGRSESKVARHRHGSDKQAQQVIEGFVCPLNAHESCSGPPEHNTIKPDAHLVASCYCLKIFC
jgi:hypothetical protein